MPESLLSIQGVTKNFAEVQALHEINLEIHSGEIVGLVGSNGAGKTTLLRLMAGVYRLMVLSTSVTENLSQRCVMNSVSFLNRLDCIQDSPPGRTSDTTVVCMAFLIQFLGRELRNSQSI